MFGETSKNELLSLIAKGGHPVWVEFSVRIGQRYSKLKPNKEGAQLVREIEEHLHRKKGQVSLDRAHYGRSAHSKGSKHDYDSLFVTGYHSRYLNSCDIYWLKDSGIGDLAGFFVVGERKSAGNPQDFSLDVLREIEEALPRQYQIVSHSLSINGVDHRFAVADHTEVGQDLVVAIMIAAGWTLIAFLRGRVSDFWLGFGANAIYALLVAVLSWLWRKRNAGRKVVYVGGR